MRPSFIVTAGPVLLNVIAALICPALIRAGERHRRKAIVPVKSSSSGVVSIGHRPHDAYWIEFPSIVATRRDRTS